MHYLCSLKITTTQMNRSTLKRTKKINDNISSLILLDKKSNFSKTPLSKKEIDYVKSKIKKEQFEISLNQPDKSILIIQVETSEQLSENRENFRIAGARAAGFANANKLTDIAILNFSSTESADLLAAEGMALTNYQFLKYKKDKETNSLKNIHLSFEATDKKAVDDLQNVIDGVYYARTLVNEPLNFLTAVQFSKEITKLGKKAGCKVTVFDKKKIQKENFAGLLAVNLGSPDPPTFSIMEWKPKNAKNKKPIVLVGKGIVFDTGGLSLKPTSNSMDIMKCDMAGGAAVVGAMYALASNKLPLHVIALIPATDNRPGQNAYVPGDIIKMRDGLSVEVLNTDAEGRMVLADALSYAKNYDPELVIDFATLTGASMRSVGPHGTAMMSKADRKTTDLLIESGYNTYERLIEFPLWKEYGNMIKSDIADIKNVGGALSGGITAGKFLENFTSYPWMHLDIAPTGWYFSNDAYRLKNGSGVGVRLLFDFLSKIAEK